MLEQVGAYAVYSGIRAPYLGSGLLLIFNNSGYLFIGSILFVIFFDRQIVGWQKIYFKPEIPKQFYSSASF